MLNKLIICADDFAQNPAICQGILSLLTAGKINATSCMTNSPLWAAEGKSLLSLSSVDVGLHINFTHGQPNSSPAKAVFGDHFPSLSSLSLMLCKRQLSRDVIKAEIKAQIDAFSHVTGFLPHFLDGHQHVHHFPKIRQALIEVYQHYWPDKTAYIRVSANPLSQLLHSPYRFKALLVAVTGAWSLQRLLQSQQIPHNHHFAGIYNFAQSANYQDYFQQFQQQLTSGGILMCHPGLPSHDQHDPIAKARTDEYHVILDYSPL